MGDRFLYKAPELPITPIERPRADKPRESYEFILGWFVFDGLAFPSYRGETLRTDQSVENIYPGMTGRFIIVSVSKGQCQCLSDPGGLLSVVYRNPGGDIGSTPRALELAEPIQVDQTVNTGLIRGDRTVWFPFGVTPFEDIYRLLPATSLTLPAGKTVPVAEKPEVKIPVQEAVGQIYEHASRFIRAMGVLGTLECHLTAGWDSRMVLSAALNTPARLNCLTYKTPGSNGSIDCQISRLIAKKYSLDHREISLQEPRTRDIDDWRWRTADCIQDSVMRLTRTVEETDANRYTLCGLAGEVGRAFYWRPPDLDRTGMSPDELLNRIGFKRTALASNLAANWLESLERAPTSQILDQAYIDLRLGGWGGPSIYGHPVAKPTLTPFNNFTVFALMKSLPRKYRFSGQFARDFVSLGSKGLAEIPVNRAHGLRRFQYLKKEIVSHMPTGAKSALKAMIAR